MANLYKMFLKQILFSKKSIASLVLALIIPLFDPYYNLNLIDHIILSLKIHFGLIILITLILYLIEKNLK